MRAIVLRSNPTSLAIEELPKPEPQKGEALVKIRAAALNRRDHWISIGKYAKIQYPAVLGSDGAGVVEDVADAEHRPWVGQEVIINPGQHWGDSTRAQSSEYTILGMPAQGTLADYIVVPVDRLVPKPGHLHFSQAAAIPLAGLTAYRSVVTQGKVHGEQNVLVTGIGGGVALFVMQFALAQGANVIVTSSSDDKIRRAIELGAVGGANSSDTGWESSVQRIRDGIDVVIDSVGGEIMNALMQIVRPGGTIVSYGSSLGAVPSFELRRIFWKQLRLVGSTMGTDAEFRDMTELIERRGIVPVIDSVHRAEDFANAFERMNNSDQFGKIVIEF